MKDKIQNIKIQDYDYTLPEQRIAKYPLAKRDASKLLLYNKGNISETLFADIGSFMPHKSLLVFNNTKVIQARLMFNKTTGAAIEIFCLSPYEPSDYSDVFAQHHSCVWLAMLGNLKKWKEGKLSKTLIIEGEEFTLWAENMGKEGEAHKIKFSWNNERFCFAQIIENLGELPIPPYLNRKTETEDLERYQTIYSKAKGSVAAPTAGLHFTGELIESLKNQGVACQEICLHVGAGTFKPVKSVEIGGHSMHAECFTIEKERLSAIISHLGNIIAVGTTAVRTLESLYYIGLLINDNPDISQENLHVDQWIPYETDAELPVADALQHIVDYLQSKQLQSITCYTRIMIVPSFKFKLVKGIITNFHQPQSTLLLLISAFVGEDWHRIYEYALTHDFRFLSYGDSSLLI
ncbi:S-adenosylmethionine:tRNA ribosyltransferase-isomerase [Bacteroidales bacterium]|nr:S-adenosylmethionine:tRNA ribosyltransferase-isomerase [Bacteroidales bacterium]